MIGRTLGHYRITEKTRKGKEEQMKTLSLLVTLIILTAFTGPAMADEPTESPPGQLPPC